MGCSERENPTGIETNLSKYHGNLARRVAASVKTRQGLKPAGEGLGYLGKRCCCSERENPTGIETLRRDIGGMVPELWVAASVKTRQGLKLVRMLTVEVSLSRVAASVKTRQGLKLGTQSNGYSTTISLQRA